MKEPAGQMPDAILFDLDNTLCTFTDAKHAACTAVIRYLAAGNPEDLFQYFLRPVRGFEDSLHIHDYLKDRGVFTPELADHAVKLFEETKIAHVTPYPGVIQAIITLYEKSIPMAIVTDASTGQAKKRLDRCGLADFFQVLITPDITGKRKPDHTPFLHAIRELNIQADDIWLVGDSIRREMIPGNELGYTTVHARYGDWIGDSPNEKPVHVIDRFSDLLPLLGIVG